MIILKFISELKEIIKIKDERIKFLENQLNENKNEQKNEEIKNVNTSYNNFNIKLKEPIHILNKHTSCVYCLTILKDGRLVSGSYDKSIIVYNKETFKPDLTIKEHNSAIYCIITLSSGILASCSDDKTIKLFNIKDKGYNVFQTLNYHSERVNKIIELKNKYLVSCSNDKSINFYMKDNNEYIKDYTIKTKDICTSVIQTKDNEICYSEKMNDSLCFYDLQERKIKSSISNINKRNDCYERFIMINKDLLLIPGENKISIINVNKYNLVRIIDTSGSGWIFGVYILNENILLTGDGQKTIRQWKIEGDNLILISQKENSHGGDINYLMNLGKGYIASASDDCTIKIW